jgi:hypothetical protein
MSESGRMGECERMERRREKEGSERISEKDKGEAIRQIDEHRGCGAKWPTGCGAIRVRAHKTRLLSFEYKSASHAVPRYP